MKNTILSFLFILATALFTQSCNDNSEDVKEKTIKCADSIASARLSSYKNALRDSCASEAMKMAKIEADSIIKEKNNQPDDKKIK